MNPLLETLSNCSAACQFISIDRLKTPPVRKTTRVEELLKDCMEICEVAISLLKRESLHSKAMLKFCARVCFKTAEELQKFENTELRHCAEICKFCAIECAHAT